MSCEHEVRFTIKPTDDACRFHFDVRAYKDRIVAPDEYSGVTEVTPSHIEQVLPTTDKLVRDDITIFPAPTEYLSTDHNGTFVPSDGKVGFSEVSVDVTGIMDKLLEVVSSVTPEQNVDSLEFPCDKKTGAYIIVSDPPGTPEFASQQSWSQTFSVMYFNIHGVSGGSLIPHQATTICYRRTPTSTEETDYWTPKISLGENSITVNPTQGRYPFLAGVTYYLLRVKGV